MKKIIAHCLINILLFSNIGFAINIHSCEGKIGYENRSGYLDHCSLNDFKKTCCNKIKTDNCNCCKQEYSKQPKDKIAVDVSKIKKTNFFTSRKKHLKLLSLICHEPIKVSPCFIYEVKDNPPSLYKLNNQYILYA